MSTRTSPQQNRLKWRDHLPGYFSLFNLPIRHRLPLLIGALLVAIFAASAFASYRAVRESSFEIGRERLRNLTQQFVNLSEQSAANRLKQTLTVATNPVIRAVLRSPTSATKAPATAILQQFAPAQDPNNLQVELWDANHNLALIVPQGLSPIPASLDSEFKQCATNPFKTAGALRVVNDTIIVPAVAAARDDSGSALGYLVTWRKVSISPGPRQLTELLGDQATLYFGNAQGSVWTNLTKILPQPPINLNSSSQVTHYTRDGHGYLALGRQISGTPWAVAIEISDEAFVAQANDFLRRMTFMGLGLLAIGIAGAVALSRNITRPLHSLTAAASVITSGDYSHTVEVQRNDEVGALANAFNSMVLKTRDSRRDLEQKIQEGTLQLEAAPCGMLMVNNKGLITRVNNQTEKLFGYDRQELLGQPVEVLVPERYRSSHPNHRKIFSRHPNARAMGAGRDLYGLRKDGHEFPVEIGLNPIDTEQGTMVLGTIVDITERKLAEQKLRHSQEQLAGVIGSAMDAIITVDGAQRIVLFNAAAELMFVFPAEAAIGQPIDRFIPERFHTAHRGHIQNFGQTNVTKRSMGTLGALYGLRANGQEFPIEASISQIESEGQKLFTVILRDITQRKQTEAALKEQAQVLDLAPVFVREPVNDLLVFWNTGAQQMYGWNEEEALGRAAYQLLHTVFPEPREKIQATLFARGHWEGELMHTRRDGQQIVAASHWVLHRDDQGKPKAILEVNNDITNWRRAEEKLTRLATAVEQSGDSIVITDTEGNIQYVNPAFEETTGYTSDEVMGKNPRFLKGGRAKVEYYQNLWKTITSGAEWTGHFTNRKKDGTLFEEEASISPVRDSAGKIISYVAVKRDVTEGMRAQEEIRQLNEELEQRVADRTAQLQAANKELEAFSYSVSHDLRAPLRHINGFSQALLEDYADQLDTDGKSYLQQVRNASQEMAQLIDDVLQLARVTRSEMHREEVSLSDLARAVVADLQKTNNRRTVTVNIEDGLYTRGDKHLLRIVLMNLLGNAWKFTSKEESAKITFGCERSNGEVAYFVRDNGAGFDMSYVNKLFGAFQRLHTAGEFEGTGIGLATVQRIVTRHGGRVWAEGKLNEGATFYFALPNFKEIGDE